MDAVRTGRFIAELRKQAGYTQKELADRLMVTDKAVSRWETGKGLPDTSLLRPLSEILGVSVGELLSGARIEEAHMREQTDQVILDALRYSGRTLAGAVTLVLLLAGAALLLSPLWTAGRTYWWIAGIVLVAAGVLRICRKRAGKTWKLTDRACYGVGVGLQLLALILEILPISAVLVFAPGPDQRLVRIFSCFDPILLGYANFAPMLTGILTVLALVCGGTALLRFEAAGRRRRAAFLCSVFAALLALAPLLLFGGMYMTAASYAICAAMTVSAALQAVANRRG